MAKKRVLICGASGFIGRNLFETLSKHDVLEVFGTYYTNQFSDNPHLLKADLTNKNDALRVTKDIDIVIQAAAVTSGAKDILTRPYIHVTDNVLMNTNICQAAYDNNVSKYIFFSCTVMYPVNTGRPLKETGLDLNAEVYKSYFGGAWMKIYIEKLCEFYSRLGKTKFTVIRHSNIYGPHDKFDLDRSHVFGATVSKVLADSGEIIVWGDGSEERDFLYVSDLVAFVELILSRHDLTFDVFNVGSGVSISIKSLVEKMVKLSKKYMTISYDTSRPTIPIKLQIDISKARKRFSWEPLVTLDQGIIKTFEWYRENIG